MREAFMGGLSDQILLLNGRNGFTMHGMASLILERAGRHWDFLTGM